jgi:hypothetical protein
LRAACDGAVAVSGADLVRFAAESWRVEVQTWRVSGGAIVVLLSLEELQASIIEECLVVLS